LAAATETYTRLLEMSPAATISRGRLAEVLAKQGQNDRAMAVLRDGIALQPPAPLLYRGLGMLLERSGQLEDAARAYREYARLEPGTADSKQFAEPGGQTG